MTKDTLLSVEGVRVTFGGIVALDDVSFDVRKGDICGLIGPNGAGKTTLFNCLSRLYTFSKGEITFDGTRLSTQPVHAMAALGIGRTFQNLAMFKTLTVRENIATGGHSITQANFLASALGLPSVRREAARLNREVQRYIDVMDLGPYADTMVSSLPFGIQKRVELARALAAHPKMILLDEPAAGLNHDELGQLSSVIRRLRSEFGITVLLVEHHMGLVMSLSDHVVVLNFGRKIAEGTPDEVRENPAVIEAYLGSSKKKEAAA